MIAIAQNNREGKSKAAEFTPPRTHAELYEPMDDEPSKDPERSINHFLHNPDVFIRVECKYNTNDVDEFGAFHEDLENEQSYVKAIEVMVFGQNLDRIFLQSIRCYCPVLVYTEARGPGTMFRFIHPKFFN